MNVNSEEIMKQIRAEISEKGLSADMLSFEDIPCRKPAQSTSAAKTLEWLGAHCYIQPYKQLAGNAVSVFTKKVIRRLTRFYVEPVVFEQNDFNSNVVSAVSSLTEENRKLAERISRLEAENAELREKLETKRRKRK